LFSDSAKTFDDGVVHLPSVRDAYEGSSFAGLKIRFISERQCADGDLDSIRVLIIPDTPAVTDAAFVRLNEYVVQENCVVRTRMPMPYTEHGHSRQDAIPASRNAIIVRGMNLPTEYLHAMEGVFELNVIDPIPRLINQHGYAIEGIKTLHAEVDGLSYLYVVNLRKDERSCILKDGPQAGHDLIHDRPVTFPMTIKPLYPMLIRLEERVSEPAA